MRIELPGDVVVHTEHVVMERATKAVHDELPGLELTTDVPMFQPATIQVGSGAQLTFNCGAMLITLNAAQAAAYKRALSRGGTGMGVPST